MATGSYTRSQTFTVADIKKVLGSFAAEFDMAAASSGVSGWPRDKIDKTVADLVTFADNDVLSAIDVTLVDAEGDEVRAARYDVSDDAAGWTGDRPGNSLWPRTPGGRIRLIALWSSAWSRLTPQGQASIRAELNYGWPETTEDVDHDGLTSSYDRRFASNGFGLSKKTYGY